MGFFDPRQHIWKRVAEKAPLGQVLTVIAEDVESSNRACLCSILLLDNTAGRLHLGAAHPEVQPNWLELEVLETSALEDMAQVHRVMHTCHDLVVRFALDDFGTGYSSLTYLKHLPADTLKIDRSFVLGMIGDPDDLAIVQGIIGLASAFRRGMIAEGVETATHGELLLDLGCELAQGYGIARPMPAREIPEWVAQWRPDTSWSRPAPTAPTRAGSRRTRPS